MRTRKQNGQNLTELGLVCGLVILTAVLALTQSGTQISGIFNQVDTRMKTALIDPIHSESSGALGADLADTRRTDITGTRGIELPETQMPETGGARGKRQPVPTDPKKTSANDWSKLKGLPRDAEPLQDDDTGTRVRILNIKTIIDENGQAQQLVEAVATTGVKGKAAPKP